MFPKGLDEKFLRYMFRRHVSQFGYRTSNLHESKLYITAGSGIEQDVPEILVISNGMKKYLVPQAAQELERQGYVVFNIDNSAFWLTEQGFRRAGLNPLQRSLAFLNNNAGLGIPIALLSLVVAVIALVSGSGQSSTL
ncbi:hypothetical protein [Lysobacter niastensis]|uniref:Uncharacterized protein n=1 Tax=Lysobacter niastensis TaxID=380629 RepID=A0ABS0B2T0_9GAMM|nr:hypothetical protein [Lysobacter niastensis]MBF6022797.1 hypothetical protein [Lysobacter niastensis]